MTNDLHEIKAFHDALPGPSAAATAAARELLAAEAAAAGQPPRTGSARRRLLIRAGTVGLAAAVAAVAFVVGADGGATPASAAELLQKAATAADRQQAPGADQFVYVNRMDQNWILAMSQGEGRSEFTTEISREAWIPVADPGNALIRSAYVKRRVHAGHVPSSMPTPGTVTYHRGRCAMEVLPTAEAGNLPADPDRLLAQVRADAETLVRNEQPAPGEDQVMRRVERTVASRLVALAQNPFPGPGLRAAVLSALSKLPTATMRTDLADPAGRQGVGASIRYQGPDGWERTELIFEPGTYRFLGWRHLSQRPDGGAEVLRQATAILETKVVDALPEIPAGTPEPATC
ncbi:CU044_5270 family protein [Nonomuraea sp. SBT364]|uniref:CU044_5270 family protein n=1 Tax=Nonomuraea sp. SBT364 TaxID=1580530 RepID=UPI00066E3ACB|nr:CU044_5270 family protein [Nonomuraea sp. SBT364]